MSNKFLATLSIVIAGILYFVLHQNIIIAISISFGFIFGVYALIRNLTNNDKQEKQRSIGEQYELYVGKEYEDRGYTIKYRGIDLGKLDGGIDLIATKDNQTILIQCKYWYQKDSIDHKMIKEFYGNCNIYMNKQDFSEEQRDNTICIFVVPAKTSLHYSAQAICKENYKYLRYKIIKANIKI